MIKNYKMTFFFNSFNFTISFSDDYTNKISKTTCNTHTRKYKSYTL